MISDLLAQHPFVSRLTTEQIEALSACATLERFGPGATIFREREPATACYLLRGGRVALQLHAPDGPLILETLEGEQVLGWSWLVPPHRWRFDAVAQEGVEAITLDAERTRSLLLDDPQLASVVKQQLLVVLADRLERTRVRLLDVYGHPHAARV
jgi:CRP-like cAMP-binding protein